MSERKDCQVCGEPGTYINGYVVCDKRECEQEIANSVEAEREEAHYQIDQDYGVGW